MTGKPVRSDLRARKKSLPVVAALTAGTAAAGELAALLARDEPLSEDDLLRAAGLVEEAGGKDLDRERGAARSSPPRTSAWRTPTCPTTSGPSSPGSPSSSPRANGERCQQVREERMTVTHPRPQGRAATTPAQALARARDHLLGLQHEQGWWQGELETNVTMDAEDLLLREFLRHPHREQTDAAARWIASQQRDDGTWANFYGGPGDLSTTVEAYVALRLAGHQPSRAAHGQGRGVDPGRGRDPGHPGVHPDLAGPVRRMVLG